MKIVVDKEKCIGCSLCDDISENAMGTQFGEEGKALQNPDADLTDRVVVANVKMAIEVCPTQAIALDE